MESKTESSLLTSTRFDDFSLSEMFVRKKFLWKRPYFLPASGKSRKFHGHSACTATGRRSHKLRLLSSLYYGHQSYATGWVLKVHSSANYWTLMPVHVKYVLYRVMRMIWRINFECVWYEKGCYAYYKKLYIRCNIYM